MRERTERKAEALEKRSGKKREKGNPVERETRERNPGNGTLWKGKTEKGARETESCGKRNR